MPTTSTRVPVEAPEGIVTGIGTGVGVSLTEIQVLDMLGEGEIEGLVTGSYTYGATLGNIGYDSYLFSGYEPVGGVRWLRSIYWNEVPVVNSENKFNFNNVKLAFTPGKPLGATISSLNSNLSDDLTVSRSLGERLRAGADFAKIYRIINRDCKAVAINIKVTSFGQNNTTSQAFGDIEQTTVTFQLFYRPIYSNPSKGVGNFIFFKEDEIKGKVSQGFIKSLRISLNSDPDGATYSDPDFLGWEIKIQRITPDATTSYIRNQTFIDSLTEIYDNTFLYPNSAIVASKFSAEYFSQVPARAFEAKLLKVKIPSNYDPIKKSYTGTWDGTFAANKAWTDNPAWCFYDLLTNKRYGLGGYIEESLVDKWTLYEIAQYCDTMVSDGFGGVEPRFTCNLIIASREEAYKVINDMASVFRAITYYSAGAIYAAQDRPRDKENFFIFTNANVENGDFTYSSSSRRVRHTVAVVRYNDRTNFYKPAVEYVEDVEGIKRYGIREIDVTAFGCTSRGQAVRWGRWALLSETLETETISFTAGFEGSFLRPGDVFKVFDTHRKTKRHGGRVNSMTINSPTGAASTIKLDMEVTGFVSNQLYSLSLLTPSYFYDPSNITDLNSSDISNIRRGQVQIITFSGADAPTVDNLTQISIKTGNVFGTGNVVNYWDYLVTGNPIWTLQATGSLNALSDIKDNEFNYYRAIRIEERDGAMYNVAGLEYNESKYTQIESGLGIQKVGGVPLPTSPVGMLLYRNAGLSTDNTTVLTYLFNRSSTSGVAAWRVFSKLSTPFVDADVSGSTYLINTLPVNAFSGDFVPPQDGLYYFRAYGVNSVGQLSPSFASNNITVSNVNPIRDVIISSLRLETESGTNAQGNREYQSTSVASPSFNWQLGYVKGNIDLSSAIKYKITARRPSPSGTNTPNPVIYFTKNNYVPPDGTLRYTFDFEDNANAISTEGEPGPFRDYDIVVEAVNSSGHSAAGTNYENANGYDILYVTNARPRAPHLTDINEVIDTGVYGYATSQWINPDGGTKILVFTGQYPDERAGGYLFYSTGTFTTQQAQGFVNPPWPVEAKRFEPDDNPIIIHESLTGVQNGYISLAYYDEFDKANLKRGSGTNIIPTLNASNVVRVQRRAGFEGLGLVNVWATIPLILNYNTINGVNVSIDNNLLFSKGVSSIVSRMPNYLIVRLNFKKTFINTDYFPLISHFVDIGTLKDLNNGNVIDLYDTPARLRTFVLNARTHVSIPRTPFPSIPTQSTQVGVQKFINYMNILIPSDVLHFAKYTDNRNNLFPVAASRCFLFIGLIDKTPYY